VVATVFATEAENYGQGVVYAATTRDLAGVTVSEGNVLAHLEKEVAVELLPLEFAARASVRVTAGEARTILSNMGHQIPTVIRGPKALDDVLRSTSRLNETDVAEFFRQALARNVR